MGKSPTDKSLPIHLSSLVISEVRKADPKFECHSAQSGDRVRLLTCNLSEPAFDASYTNLQSEMTTDFGRFDRVWTIVELPADIGV
jgi:hypothetical protein